MERKLFNTPSNEKNLSLKIKKFAKKNLLSPKSTIKAGHVKKTKASAKDKKK